MSRNLLRSVELTFTSKDERASVNKQEIKKLETRITYLQK